MLFLNDAQNVLVLLRKTGKNRHRTALLARDQKTKPAPARPVRPGVRKPLSKYSRLNRLST